MGEIGTDFGVLVSLFEINSSNGSRPYNGGLMKRKPSGRWGMLGNGKSGVFGPSERPNDLVLLDGPQFHRANKRRGLPVCPREEGGRTPQRTTVGNKNNNIKRV